MAQRRDPTPPPSPSSDSDSELTFPFMELTPVESATSPDSSKKDKKLQDMLSLVDQYCDTDGLSSEAIELLGAIPDGYIPVPHQMGGHKYVNGKPGFLREKKKPEYLLKPVQPFPKGNRELSFYEFLQGQELSKDMQELKKFLPKFYGVQSIPQNPSGSEAKADYFSLEDCTHPFVKPCILDLKIGKKVCEEGSTNEKILRAKEKYPVQEAIGFRIVGMRVYKVLSDSFKYYNRSYGLSLQDDEHIQQGLFNFLDNGNSVRQDLLPIIIEKITEIRDWFAKQTTYKLFATSILLIYEGSQAPGVYSTHVDVRLVDFAHAYFSFEVEDLGANCLYGSDRVLHNFEQIKENMQS